MRVRVLGPVAVSDAELPAGKPLALLAMLALAEGSSVGVDRLVNGLWGEEASTNAGKTLQVYVSTLRAALRPSGLGVTRVDGGYRLEAPTDDIDVAVFDRRARIGLAAADDGRPELAVRELRAALDTWSGDALSGVRQAPFADAEVDRLNLRRLVVVQARIDAELLLGLSSTLLDELRAIASDNVYDERACSQLMLALYRAGQPVSALDVYRTFRKRLAEELGLDPGTELRELERQILTHDDVLLAPPAGSRIGGHNLPREVSQFIGRRREVADVIDGVARSRLTTVTGAGGAGKTRLAIVAASAVIDQYPDGVWCVELAPLGASDLVATEIGRAIGSRAEGGVNGLIDDIGERRMLIILDNCEHLIEPVLALVRELLRGCGRVRFLATSREPLGIEGERVYRIPPLGLPEANELNAIRRADAVRLFVERAGMQRARFELDEGNAAVIAQICTGLDGLPFAIELAAARLRTISLDELANRLDEQFRLLLGSSRRSLGRQQTLRTLIDWSYDLLSGPEQSMLAQLSVFMNGFDIDAATAICAVGRGGDSLDLLTTLVDKSLVELIDPLNGRYRLLETVRQYGAEQLSRDEVLVDQVRAGHANYYLSMSAAARPHLEMGPDQADWLDRLELEHDNLRTAGGWLLDRGPDHARLQLANNLRLYWDMRAHFAEGAAYTLAAISKASDDTSAEYCEALCTVADLSESNGNFEASVQFSSRAVAAAQIIGEQSLVAFAACTAANAAVRKGDLDRALEVVGSVDTTNLGPELTGRIRFVRGYVLIAREDFVGARTEFEEVVSLGDLLGDRRRTSLALLNMSCVDLAEGELELAAAHLEQARIANSSIRDLTTTIMINVNLGLTALLRGDLETARLRYREGLLNCNPRADVTAVLACLLGVAVCVPSAEPFLRKAAMLHGALDALSHGNQTAFDATELRFRDADRTRIFESLGQPEFDVLLHAGGRLTLLQAIELARTMRVNRGDT